MRSPVLHYPKADFPRIFCPKDPSDQLPASPLSHRLVRNGGYWRSSDRIYVQGYLCRTCGHSFGSARFKPCYWQKKRQLNFEVWKLCISQVSQNQIARLLNVDRRTVARKKKYLHHQARLLHREFLSELSRVKSPEWPRRTAIQFDEMVSFEHTKCKPLSIPLVVDEHTRLILGLDVCQMPAQGPLAETSRRKYGPRPNHRIPTLNRLFRSLRRVEVIHPGATFRSDSHPYYSPQIRSLYPDAIHEKEESRRAAVVGQGELKKIGWDPLFPINHTAAMNRGHLARLVRRSWCTTKKRVRLKGDLLLYTIWHNKMILAKLGASPAAHRWVFPVQNQKTGPPV